MSGNSMSRKELFLVALSRSRFRSVAEWAREAGVSRTHLVAVLDEKRESVSLTEKVDAFISEHALSATHSEVAGRVA